ncbi:MAG: CcmD family protein [Saprospiraceae bacterium]|nr:CcmD family protein [Saprospiraceae bacterium]
MKYEINMRIILALIFLPCSVMAQANDFMRSTGKMNVVYGVILIIFLGLTWFLIKLDKRIQKLEINQKDEQ